MSAADHKEKTAAPELKVTVESPGTGDAKSQPTDATAPNGNGVAPRAPEAAPDDGTIEIDLSKLVSRIYYDDALGLSLKTDSKNPYKKGALAVLNLIVKSGFLIGAAYCAYDSAKFYNDWSKAGEDLIPLPPGTESTRSLSGHLSQATNTATNFYIIVTTLLQASQGWASYQLCEEFKIPQNSKGRIAVGVATAGVISALSAIPWAVLAYEPPASESTGDVAITFIVNAMLNFFGCYNTPLVWKKIKNQIRGNPEQDYQDPAQLPLLRNIELARMILDPYYFTISHPDLKDKERNTAYNKYLMGNFQEHVTILNQNLSHLDRWVFNRYPNKKPTEPGLGWAKGLFHLTNQAAMLVSLFSLFLETSHVSSEQLSKFLNGKYGVWLLAITGKSIPDIAIQASNWKYLVGAASMLPTYGLSSMFTYDVTEYYCELLTWIGDRLSRKKTDTDAAPAAQEKVPLRDAAAKDAKKDAKDAGVDVLDHPACPESARELAEDPLDQIKTPNSMLSVKLLMAVTGLLVGGGAMAAYYSSATTLDLNRQCAENGDSCPEPVLGGWLKHWLVTAASVMQITEFNNYSTIGIGYCFFKWARNLSLYTPEQRELLDRGEKTLEFLTSVGDDGVRFKYNEETMHFLAGAVRDIKPTPIPLPTESDSAAAADGDKPELGLS